MNQLLRTFRAMLENAGLSADVTVECKHARALCMREAPDGRRYMSVWKSDDVFGLHLGRARPGNDYEVRLVLPRELALWALERWLVALDPEEVIWTRYMQSLAQQTTDAGTRAQTPKSSRVTGKKPTRKRKPKRKPGSGR